MDVEDGETIVMKGAEGSATESRNVHKQITKANLSELTDIGETIFKNYLYSASITMGRLPAVYILIRVLHWVMGGTTYQYPTHACAKGLNNQLCLSICQSSE